VTECPAERWQRDQRWRC